MPLYEVWGMSELTGPATAVPHDEHKAPSIGKAIAGVEVKLAEDGEILVRGGNVMVGYYRDPEKTADTIDSDGWVHSGDIGQLDADGQFRIVDRKKELIINSAGKNISPLNLEALAKSSPIIGQAVAIGDARKFISVLPCSIAGAPAWPGARPSRRCRSLPRTLPSSIGPPRLTQGTPKSHAGEVQAITIIGNESPSPRSDPT